MKNNLLLSLKLLLFSTNQVNFAVLVQRGVNQATILKLAKALIYKTFDFRLPPYGTK